MSFGLFLDHVHISLLPLRDRALTCICGRHGELRSKTILFWKCSWAHAVISMTRESWLFELADSANPELYITLGRRWNVFESPWKVHAGENRYKIAPQTIDTAFRIFLDLCPSLLLRDSASLRCSFDTQSTILNCCQWTLLVATHSSSLLINWRIPL